MFNPSRILDFLGLHFNLERALISPPDSFLDSLTSVLFHLSTSTVMPACKISSFAIRISHFAPFIHHGCLHLRFLQFWIKRHWAQHRLSWDTQIQLDAEFLSQLRLFNRQEVLEGVPLHLPEPTLFFFTDASLTGWGASWQNRHLSGQWYPPESSQHINWLELEAIRLAVLQWGPQWHNQTVHVYCDNSTALTGRDPFHISVQQNCGTLSSSGPVWDSSHSDPLSRSQECDSKCPVSAQQSQSDRMEDSSRNLTQSVLGTPLVDMFTTAENRVTPVYISPYPDDRAWAVDTISISWDSLGLVYAFLPAPIVPKTLQKIKDSRDTTVILIASQHPSQQWHPLLLQISRRPPILLTNVALYQYIPNIRCPQFHREPRLLDLAVWLLSGITSDITIFQTL